MERPNYHEQTGGPLHLARCMGQLVIMYVQEKSHALRALLDTDAWPDDSPEDQEIKSGRWQS